jgi:ABC-type branched-subunit amino acid transport system substrate-binding protein
MGWQVAGMAALAGALLLSAPASAPAATTAGAAADATPLLQQAPDRVWTTYTERDGLPSNHAFAVRIDGPRVWAGTTNGLALFENGRWRAFGTADGLPHRVVLSLDVCPRSGDLWIGTIGGLARLSAGRFDVYTQMNSGLSNDFVHGVRCDEEDQAVWAATAMGASRLDLRTGAWSIFTQENTPMHEPWTYSVALQKDKVFIGAWGAGILEYTKATGNWREYRDPDDQFEIDLFPDDGPISDVTAGVDAADGLLWQATYTGLARYDGRRWRSWTMVDSGLAGDFINFVRARGRLAWLATDRGLSVTDGDGWFTYKRLPDGRGEVLVLDGTRRLARRVASTAMAHNYVLGVDASEREVWVATQEGVSRGVLVPGSVAVRAGRDRTAGEGSAAGGARESGRVARAAVPPRFHYAGVPDALLPFPGAHPYRDLFTERSQFLGAGREDPEPRGLTEVRLGFIGPLLGSDLPGPPRVLPPIAGAAAQAAIGRRMLHAAQLAVDQANAQGGYHGRPFRLVPRSDMVLWGQSSNELAGFALDDRVWAVLASINSNHNHVLSRATLKLMVPIVSAGSTDPTLVEHSIPWLVRCINDDRQAAYVLLAELARRGLGRTALLRVNDRDGRTGVGELVEGARRVGRPIILEQRFDDGATEFGADLRRIQEMNPDSLVLWGNPPEAALAVRQARALGLHVPIFGFSRLQEASFLQATGEAAEDLTVVATMNPERGDPRWAKFRQSYLERWGEPPDTFAAHAYDGMELILGAVRRGGLNRARIRDALFDLQTYDGVTGHMVFDTNMSDIGPLWLARVAGGRFVYEPAPSWGRVPVASGAPAGAGGPGH